ncbi:MAG: GNAT family N-acetyltransferase [Deltaproteobacteria bacterium]|jgi:ribosomal-protein-alanine N-acetyltransferase|nr:GNAT family N-acetyltransferase [Deltaproteobacteria bacterium]
MLKPPEGYALFLLGEEDAPELAALEAVCFSMPWTMDMCKSFLLAGRGFFSGPLPPGDCAEDLGIWRVPGALGPMPVLGLRSCAGRLAACLSLSFPAGSEDLEICNLGVLPGLRRQGLGRRLLVLGLNMAAQLGARRALLEVRPGNRPAVALYGHLGFTPCGRRKSYYADTGEDALILECFLPTES